MKGEFFESEPHIWQIATKCTKWGVCTAHLADHKGRRRRKKKSEAPTYLPFLRFFEIFRSDFRKYLYGVFGLLMQRNGQKRDKTNRWEKTKGKSFFFLNCFGQKFLTWISQKVFYGAFQLPLLRNAQKRHKKKKKKKVPTYPI
jgi:hypothetical protein